MRKRIKRSDTKQAVLVTYTDIASVGTTYGSLQRTENTVHVFTDKVKHAEGVFIKADYQQYKRIQYVKAEIERTNAGKPVDVQTHKKLIQHGPSDAASAFKTMQY